MRYKKIFITSIFIFLGLYVFSQKDTTICFEINSIKDQNTKKNILGIDICYGYEYYSSVPMVGINYERIIRKNNTLSLSGESNFYPFGRYNAISSYGKFEYRFYYPDTRIPKTSSFRDNFYLQKKKKNISNPQGFYWGIVMIYQNHRSENINSNTGKKRQKLINSIGLGGSLGYQFVLFNKIQTNISLPLVFGYKRVIKNYNPYEKDYIDISYLIDINFGIAF